MNTDVSDQHANVRYQPYEKPPVAMLDADASEVPDEREVSLRLLRDLASSVRHEQYHDAEIVTVRVALP